MPWPLRLSGGKEEIADNRLQIRNTVAPNLNSVFILEAILYEVTLLPDGCGLQ